MIERRALWGFAQRMSALAERRLLRATWLPAVGLLALTWRYSAEGILADPMYWLVVGLIVLIVAVAVGFGRVSERCRLLAELSP